MKGMILNCLIFDHVNQGDETWQNLGISCSSEALSYFCARVLERNLPINSFYFEQREMRVSRYRMSVFTFKSISACFVSAHVRLSFQAPLNINSMLVEIVFNNELVEPILLCSTHSILRKPYFEGFLQNRVSTLVVRYFLVVGHSL